MGLKKVAAFIKRQDACWWFRVHKPMSYLNITGQETREVLVEQAVQCPHCGTKVVQEIQWDHAGNEYKCRFCFVTIVNGIKEWRDSIFATLDWCDVAVFQRNTDKSHLQLMKEAKRRGKFVISEADDNYFDVPSNNPGYQHYAERKGIIEEMYRISDGMTVTTNFLRERYLPYNKNIAVIPNAFDVDLFNVTPPLPQMHIFDGKQRPLSLEQFYDMKSKRKFVCWAGSPTHEDDLAMIVRSLKKLIEKENVIVGMVAFVHRAMIELFPPDRLLLFGLVPVMNWYNVLQTLRPDVWLGPLVDNKFNRSKSNIKKIEATLSGGVFVGSDLDPYNQDSLDGFLVPPDENQWWFNLRRAVNMDSEEKEAILSHNREVIINDFDIKSVAPKWAQFFNSGVACEV